MPRLPLILLLLALPTRAAPNRQDIEFFEARIRPVLANSCYKCHSASSKKLKASLRLDSRAAMLKGGDTGPALVPGKPDESLLIKAINHDPAADLDMPPKEKLSSAAIADLTAWVQRGAPWPEEKPPQAIATIDKTALFEKARHEHWAFQPLKNPTPPPVHNIAWPKTPIDHFILHKLEEKNIAPNPPADPYTLLRRVYLDLIGLPPTPAEQDAFSSDTSPNALEKVVDNLLARPEYGQRWGRHWLDVARYAESQGYERDEPKPYAWTYRDYVINSFNADKPYDQFVREQIAGDEIENANAQTQTATSFLRLGPFDTIAADAKLARYDQLDDIVGTTTAAFLAQTVRCARCHDHKFEPYAQADYYKLIALFEPLTTRRDKETSGAGILVGNAAELAAYHESQKPFDAQAQPIQSRAQDLKISIVEETLSHDAKLTPPLDPKRKTDLQNLLAILKMNPSDLTKAQSEMLPRAKRKIDEAARQYAKKDQKTQLEKLDDALDKINARRPKGHRAFIFTEDSSKPPVTHLFLRGDCNKPAQEIDPAIPTVLGGDATPPWSPPATTSPPQSSHRRLYLANYLTSPQCAPLLARVFVNRIWQHHFGQPIVATPNDFGLHGDPPSHPDLLEYLANQLIQNHWTQKRLHKMIILSAVYQISSAYHANPADPDNRLLAHWPTHRLEAEAIRDSLLAVSGQLNLQAGGPSVFPPLSQKVVGDSAGFEWKTSDPQQANRRSVYVYVKRNVALPELDVLGMPDPSSSTGQRTITTTALQSLMLLNSQFANDQATHLAARLTKESPHDPTQQINHLFHLTLCRPPTPQEQKAAQTYLQSEPLQSLCLVLLNTNEFVTTN